MSTSPAILLDPLLLPSTKPLWRRWTTWIHAGLVLCSLQQIWFLGWILSYTFIPPHTSAFMEIQRHKLAQLESPKDIQYQWVPLHAIDSSMQKAVIASEDARFYTHRGIDSFSMMEGLKSYIAFLKNRHSQRKIIGGSTITQQVAKNLFLSPKRSLRRKWSELLITLQLEALLPKERILEIYLNIAEFGEGIFGIEAAAQHYFGHSAAHLTRAQSAQLTAMLPRPRYYQKNLSDPQLLKRKNTLLRYISD